MRTSHRPSRVLELVGLLLALGCSSAQGPNEEERGGAPERSAEACELEAPGEVGQLTLRGTERCVATLIRPQVALTAAHCLWPSFTGERSRELSVGFGRGEQRRLFAVRRIRSFDPEGATASGTGLNRDVALLELAEPVSASLARPRGLASERILLGSEVTLVTRGACSPETGAPGQSMRSFRFDPTALRRLLCPGDSGAPLLQGSPGAPGSIVAVASGYASSACAAEAPDRMLFGDVTALRPAIQAQLLAWLRER